MLRAKGDHAAGRADKKHPRLRYLGWDRIVIKRVSVASSVALVATTMTAVGAAAGTRGYDLGSLLFEEHPFATNAPLAPVVAAPAAPPQVRRYAPAPYSTQPVPPTASPYAAGPAINAAPRQPVYRQPAWQDGAVAPAPWQLAVSPAAGPRSPPPKILSEVRFGLMVHDIGPFSSNEEGGLNSNVELLFVSPDILDVIWSPRPHAGFSINSEGHTSQVYAGLTWEWPFWGNWFANFSLGGSVNNGKTTTDRLDRKELGCHLLFRESAELGYRFGGRHSISGLLDHISNANICDKNEGIDTVGLRYGYRF